MVVTGLLRRVPSTRTSSLLPANIPLERACGRQLVVLTCRPRSAGDEGATAVEYGLLVALIAAVIAAVVDLLGKAVFSAFNSMIGTF